jgi:selenocysteine lyase/cysteine desulfurase
VVTALPAGARVVVPDVEFTSNLFPYLVQSRLDVRTVPVAAVADAVADGAGAVAFSAVQMSTGEVADVDAILDAASAVDAVTICDATQATGWLPIDAGRFDAVVRGLQGLMSPRGLPSPFGPRARRRGAVQQPAGTPSDAASHIAAAAHARR